MTGKKPFILSKLAILKAGKIFSHHTFYERQPFTHAHALDRTLQLQGSGKSDYYLRSTVEKQIRHDLMNDATFVGARTARPPEHSSAAVNALHAEYPSVFD